MEQKKVIIDGLLSNPLLVNSFLKLYNFMKGKAITKYREIAFNKERSINNYIKNKRHRCE
jgi:hypothetical protein